MFLDDVLLLEQINSARNYGLWGQTQMYLTSNLKVDIWTKKSWKYLSSSFQF
jgi:hypothetical protein